MGLKGCFLAALDGFCRSGNGFRLTGGGETGEDEGDLQTVGCGWGRLGVKIGIGGLACYFFLCLWLSLVVLVCFGCIWRVLPWFMIV